MYMFYFLSKVEFLKPNAIILCKHVKNLYSKCKL